jgi:hypothetical protein
MHKLKHEWNEYFSGTPVAKLSSVECTSRLTYSNSSVYILNCLFKEITSTSYGGALYCSSATNMLIESTSFFSCRTSSSDAGAIYFTNSESQCVLYGVCGYDCCSTYASGNSWYQFAFITVNDVSSSKNYINYSSISRCVNERSGSYYIIPLSNGKICCPSVNISMNKCQYHSVIYCYPFSDSNSVICSLSYSSFIDNIASGYTCFFFNRDGAKYEIKCCNILRNSQIDSLYGIIFARGNLIIEDSCILENTANCIFYQGYSYTITLFNCTVDKTTSYGSFTIQNTVTKSFIHGLNHMSTQNCHSEYDSAGTLTAVPYASHSTKKVLCYTWQIIHNQARISDIFSLTWVFIVAFVHPNPSNDCWYDYQCFFGEKFQE